MWSGLGLAALQLMLVAVVLVAGLAAAQVPQPAAS
jgi:hypothetical protein